MEFDDTVQALRTITDVRTRPPLVDVDRAMSTARRRRRQRRTRGAIAAIVAVTVIAVGIPLLLRTVPHAAHPVTPPSRAVACTVSVLPVPAGVPQATPRAVDSTGRYIAGELTDTGGFPLPHGPSGVIWRDGRVAATFTVAGHSQFVQDVSSTGVVVGTVDFNYPDMQGWVYVDGHVSRLDGLHTVAQAINNAGVIVGNVDQHGVPWNGQPVTWRSPTAPMTRLALPGAGWVGTATDVAADGTIVGEGRAPGTKRNVGLVWNPAGQVSEIPLPRNVPGAIDLSPLSVSRGIVVLRIYAPTSALPGRQVAATYSIATGRFTLYPYGIAPPPSPDPRVHGFAGVGFIMGAANGWFVGQPPGPDVLYLPSGASLPFPSALDQAHLELMLRGPTGMSDDGHTFAGIDSSMGPVMWTCG